MLGLFLAQEMSPEEAARALDELNAAVPAAAAATAAGVGFLAIWAIFWTVFGIAGFVLWLWALIDVIKREFPNSNDKILWLVLIFILPLIGPIAYLIVGRKKGGVAAPAQPTSSPEKEEVSSAKK